MRNALLSILLAVWLLPAVVSAQNPIVIDLSGTQPGIYYYVITVTTDGKATFTPINKVVTIGNNPAPPVVPTPFVPPTPQPPVPDIITPPPPVPTPAPVTPVETVSVEGRVQQVTQQALSNGGSVMSAVCLRRAYNIVAGALDTGQIDKSRAIDAVRTASDLALSETGETAKWSSWRSSISSLIADVQSRGELREKDQYVLLLRQIESSMNKVVNTVIATDRSKDLKDKDYDVILKLQQRIIDSLKQFKGVAS